MEVSLISRAEEAERAGPDDEFRIISEAALSVFGWQDDRYKRVLRLLEAGASLDAAMTLVPKGCGMNMTTGADELPTLIKHEDLPSSARVFFLSKRIDALAACDTLPLAICAASLRALSQGVNDDHA